MAEIITCPNCERKLQVPEEFLGQTVQCPECRHMFVAASSSVTSQPLPSATPTSPKPRPRVDDEDDRPRRRRDRDDDDFDDDDFDIHRRRRRGRNRNNFEPHRGGLIMALGLIALVGGMSFCMVPAVVGPIAWIMGSYDLRAIQDGRMDPEGESMTRAGRVCGIVATVLLVLAAPFMCLWMMAATGNL
jgi:hypothetical protein